MIKTVELGNFISHKTTRVDFDNSMTVFVGDNGAGKSSIIDAITFALFGKHTRDSNKGLIKRGESQAYAIVDFVIKGRELRATRKIDNKGVLLAEFLQKDEKEWNPIAVGERKQFGESMTEKVEEYIGLDYTKLKIASIVQQGEINSIIKSKPKEFKEMINAVVGIDKLDASSEEIKTVLREFREHVREELGYDDTHIVMLQTELEKSKKDITESTPERDTLMQQKESYQKVIQELKSSIDAEAPKADKIVQLESRRSEIKEYAKKAISDMQKEIAQKEHKLQDCTGCFEGLDSKASIKESLEAIEATIKTHSDKVGESRIETAKLNEQISLAQKLELTDGKCPVCDSRVEHLKPIFVKEHIQSEIQTLKDTIASLQDKIQVHEKEKRELESRLDHIRKNEAILQANSINDQSQLDALRQEINSQKVNMSKIPQLEDASLSEIAQLDSHAGMLYEQITKLEQETQGFNKDSFEELKRSLDIKQQKQSQIDQKLGAIQERIQSANMRQEKHDKTLKELSIVREYVAQLDKIQSSVFNRDGSVAISLRSWALDMISTRSSEYLALLGTKIQRITVSEKTKSISITCYSGNTVLPLDSLSGGEQVIVALAVRLGIAKLLGSSNVNFVILDEPTMHLDAERRQALVNVLSQLTNTTGSETNQMQFIIITHDKEIFENAAVERIYEFSSTVDGTKISAR